MNANIMKDHKDYVHSAPLIPSKKGKLLWEIIPSLLLGIFTPITNITRTHKTMSRNCEQKH